MSHCECVHVHLTIDGKSITSMWHCAREVHRCDLCAGPISVGECYERQVSMSYDSFYCMKVHLDCALDGCCHEGKRPSVRPFRRMVRATHGSWSELVLSEVAT